MAEDNVQNDRTTIIELSPQILKEMQKNEKGYSQECQDHIKKNFKFPIDYDAELVKLLEKTGGRYSFYFNQGPLTQDDFLWHINKVDERIKKQGYKTGVRYESEEPGLGILEEAPDSGLIARLDVIKKGFL